ncbi:MAG: FAD-dependent oxidoreductase [Alphaproteobacteria bacterium]|nr:FAD-dependent oxidoreductase [Alphaproteobacteria bacterium]
MKIAIIGTGISGNTAAWLLHPRHDITVYEKNDYVGGHSRTLRIHHTGAEVDVDTGFIVFNHRCYPHLTALFKHLGIATAKSDMSFGVSIHAPSKKGWLEYGTHSLNSVFGQRRNLLRPAYWRMLRDILRFFKIAPAFIARGDASVTLGEFIRKNGLGEWFRDHYLLPMGGAIWSCPTEQMLDFPALTFLRFFDNHCLLSPDGQLQWYTVEGGSKVYVEKLTEAFRDRIRLSSGVTRVERKSGKVEVTDVSGATETYDHVVFASHADETLAMLANPTPEEQRILSCFTYQPNTAYLHRDASFMPLRRASWSSWVYLRDGTVIGRQDLSLTYWMNNLQPIDPSRPTFVTLNPDRIPAPELTFDRHAFSHPVFTLDAIHAQSELPTIQGKENIWFCGAYTRYGFHEDGMMSGIAVAKGLGAEVPWEQH